MLRAARPLRRRHVQYFPTRLKKTGFGPTICFKADIFLARAHNMLHLLLNTTAPPPLPVSRATFPSPPLCSCLARLCGRAVRE
eukprot:gene14524-biopygen21646